MLNRLIQSIYSWIFLVGIIVFIITANSFYVVSTLDKLAALEARLFTTNRVISAVNTLHMAVLRAESGQRGFLLTKDEAYLEDYTSTLNRLDGLLDEVEISSQVSDLPQQDEKISQLISLSQAKIDEMISTVQTAKAGNFDITVGAYPDKHPEATSDTADVDWLKRKVDAGATRAITQFFFKAETFLRFRDRCVAAGIDIPILPGILPIQSWKGTRTFAERCGTPIPDDLAAAFETAERDGRTALLATAVCSELCSTLLENDVDHLHFYTLNDPRLTRDVVHALGLAPPAALEKVA